MVHAASVLRAVRERAWVLPEVRWASVAALAFLSALAAGAAGGPGWARTALFTLCYASGGWEPARDGLRALRQGTLDVDVLMVLAAIGAAAIGQAFDGGLLIVIFATSGAQEAFATARTRDSVRALLTLAPERAARLRPDDSEEEVQVAALAVGDVILVRPGERIGADGRVLAGTAEVDQASITGEPMPLLRSPGDEVFAGTLPIHGMLRVRVERTAAESVVARVVALVEQASATKAHAQLFVERIEQRYSVGVVLATLAVLGIPLAAGSPLRPALLRAMTFMIVASPCAVVLATMPPLLSAIATAGRHGMLVKSAIVMEQLALTSRVAFDKTGTLTLGTPRVVEVQLLPDARCSRPQVLRWAAAAERGSEHPIGRAVVAAERAAEPRLPALPAAEFTVTPGCGVRALVHGVIVEVGRPPVVEVGRTLPGTADEAVAGQEQRGRTAVVVSLDDRPVAVLALEDRLRPGAQAAVHALTSLTGSEPVLLTGDNARAGRRFADRVGIGEVHAGLLPAEKVAQVARLEQGGGRVLVVGDGINDAPALAAAHLGVAMGHRGSDLALQTADAVLVHDELECLPAAIDLSRQARRAVRQNLVLAAVAIAALVSWDLIGHLPLPLGVAGHEGGTVLVGLNGLRLLAGSRWHRPHPFPAGAAERGDTGQPVNRSAGESVPVDR